MAKQSTNLIQVAWQAHQTGNFAEAERLYRRIIRKNPRNSEAHRLLANVLRKTHRVPEAVTHLKKTLAFQPKNFDARTELARCHRDLGHLDESINEFRNAIALKPGNADAYLRPASLLIHHNHFASAEKILQEGLHAVPDDPRLMHALADTSISIGRYSRAVELYQSLQNESDTEDASIYFGLATAHRMAGNFDRAVDAYNNALTIQPEYMEALAGKAEILESRGQRDEALALIEPAMQKKGVTNPELIMTYARIAQQNNTISHAIPFVRKALQSATTEKAKRSLLFFTLGSLLEKNKQYDEAFSAYDNANRLYPKIFNKESYIKGIDQLIETFTGESLSQIPQADPPTTTPQPIYILGMMRSGTSLIEQMLSCHSDIAAGGELDCIPKRANELTHEFSPGSPYPLALNHLDRNRMNDLANSILNELHALDPNAKNITDKLPNNYVHLGFISRLFPNAKIIHCRRHPVDTCFSCFATQLGQAHTFSNNLDHLVIAYQQYHRLMNHWRKVLNIAILDVQYENMITDPEHELREILNFLDLPWEESCLKFYESSRITKTASMDQVRKPIYTTSKYRYKNFEKQIQTLITALSNDMYL